MHTGDHAIYWKTLWNIFGSFLYAISLDDNIIVIIIHCLFTNSALWLSISLIVETIIIFWCKASSRVENGVRNENAHDDKINSISNSWDCILSWMRFSVSLMTRTTRICVIFWFCMSACADSASKCSSV